VNISDYWTFAERVHSIDFNLCNKPFDSFLVCVVGCVDVWVCMFAVLFLLVVVAAETASQQQLRPIVSPVFGLDTLRICFSECKKPQADMQRQIFGSAGFLSAVWILVAVPSQSHNLIKKLGFPFLWRLMFLETELIGEFKGKNTAYRVLPDGKIETMGQGMGKLLGMDAFVMSTAVGTMANEVSVGEVNAVVTTMTGDSVMMKGTAVGYPSEQGGISRGASVQTTQSPKLSQLNKVVFLTEFITDTTDN
jgi:hypothetical protein